MLVLGRVYPIAVVSSFQPWPVALHFCRVGVHAGRLYTHVRTLVLYPARCCDQSHSLTCHMYPHTRYALFPTFAMLPCCHAVGCRSRLIDGDGAARVGCWSTMYTSTSFGSWRCRWTTPPSSWRPWAGTSSSYWTTETSSVACPWHTVLGVLVDREGIVGVREVGTRGR